MLRQVDRCPLPSVTSAVKCACEGPDPSLGGARIKEGFLEEVVSKVSQGLGPYSPSWLSPGALLPL